MSTSSTSARELAPTDAAIQGARTTKGTRVESSHNVRFSHIAYSPRCQPWSLCMTVSVVDVSPSSSSADSTRPAA